MITVTFDNKEFVIPKVKRLASGSLVTPELLSGIGLLAVRDVQRGIRAQRSPDGKAYPTTTRFGEPAQRLRDTMRLYNSITFEVQGSKVLVGTNVKYAAMQNFGGTQRPSKAKALAIPLTRQVARAVVAAGGYREAFPDAFVWRSSAQGVFLVRKNPNAGPRSKKQLEFLAILLKSVQIRGTHFLDRLSDLGETDIQVYIEKKIGQMWEARQ